MLGMLRTIRALIGVFGGYQLLGVITQCVQALTYAGPIPGFFWLVVLLKLVIGIAALLAFDWLKGRINRRAGTDLLRSTWSI